MPTQSSVKKTSEDFITTKEPPFILPSYAKINLFLDVLEKMEDGYHKINTLFSEITLHDTIKFSLTRYPEIKLLTEHEGLRRQDNLVYQVAVFIQAKYSVLNGARIVLQKNIPIAAGLGGGSSNAATTIIGLNKLWRLQLSDDEQHQIARRFGSDIAFFLHGYQAIGTNRGEVIEPLTDSDFEIENILLVNPNFHILSSEAYELVKITQPKVNLKTLLHSKNPELCYNKLEEGILEKYPVLQEIRQALLDNGARKSILSGSGATMVGFFHDIDSCTQAQNNLSKYGFWTHITSTRRR